MLAACLLSGVRPGSLFAAGPERPAECLLPSAAVALAAWIVLLLQLLLPRQQATAAQREGALHAGSAVAGSYMASCAMLAVLHLLL
jgi:hypothetical protein